MNMLVYDVVLRELKKFIGRCRLFVGNVILEMLDEEFKNFFLKFGEIGEMFLNGFKGFGFIRLVRTLE